MADLNKVFLMGRLTFNPELRHTANGTAVTELRMATTRSWLGRDNEKREETLFIDVSVWDRQAETCCQYLQKGSSVHIEGSLKMDSWDDKATGEKRTKIKIHADRVQFLDRREDGSSNRREDSGGSEGESAPPMRRPSSGGYEPRGGSNGGSRSVSAPAATPRRPTPPPPPDDDEEEDIPF